MNYTNQIEYEITFHSTAIEGSTLTEQEVIDLLEKKINPAGRPREHCYMVLDNHNALCFALQHAAQRKPVTVELIQSIAGKVLHNTGTVYNTVLGNIDSSKGEFRRGNVSAGGVYFMNYDKVESSTNKLAVFLKAEMTKERSLREVLELSFTAHWELVNIHPFYDGNGRTARLLMNYMQAYYNLPLAIVDVDDRDAYIEALISPREKENCEIFLSFMKAEYNKLYGKSVYDK